MELEGAYHERQNPNRVIFVRIISFDAVRLIGVGGTTHGSNAPISAQFSSAAPKSDTHEKPSGHYERAAPTN
jgi:hypothetical protein